MDKWTIQPIGYVRSSYTDTGQVPKGLGTKHTMEGTLEVLPEYDRGLQDIEGFSHLFILWVFHKSQGYELTGKPPTDDRPHGVFTTRSPRRPNAIGLTIVRLERVEKNRLFIKGVDMLEGTPVLDIKPYIPRIDAYPESRTGWAEDKFGADPDVPPRVADERFMAD